MRIGTRRSALALAQAELVCELLGGGEIVAMLSDGDLDPGSSADVDSGRGRTLTGAPPGAHPPGRTQAGGQDKSRWVSRLERALIIGEVDLAVHSAKDVPAELADGLALYGAPPRASAEDVVCGVEDLEQLDPGARVGTSSVRRGAQLRAARADLDVVALAGNVDTRLRKLGQEENGLDAIVLARAGLQRLGRESEAGGTLDPKRFVPAPGQGTLALEGRAGDEPTREAVRAIGDRDAFACLLAERALARALDASCNTPLGAHAMPAADGRLLLRAWVGLPDGSRWCSDELLGSLADAEALGRSVAERLLSVGAGEMLAEAEAEAMARTS